ncbi:MAG: ABC transporter permease [Anaerolineaceae bacterium]|nr:ABC transporter permease [Anaerolineaceae bacterium]
MSEAVMIETRQHKLHYRGRGGQVLIYLGKLLRGFVYQNDWKVMPLAALIAGLVSMVVKRDFFLTMEGTIKGAFALTCVGIWNGCFNSIQVVCRERDIIKREHRSGLHISAYIFAHMVYQAGLCLLQTIITLYVCKTTGMQFPDGKSLFTPWLVADIGITIFLVTYASDMLSLWVSCITRSTTTAMTVMPFILIFQLVFSGGIFTLPDWAVKISAVSISNYGLKCIAAQADYNSLPLVTGWDSIMKVEKQELSTTLTLGQVMDFLQRDDLPAIHDFREREYEVPTTRQIMSAFNVDPNARFGDSPFSYNQLLTLAEKTLEAGDSAETTEIAPSDETKPTFSIGQVIDVMAEITKEQGLRDEAYNFSATVGQLLDLVGREKAETYVKTMTADSNRKTYYEHDMNNILSYWIPMFLFIGAFALLSVIFLEFVDKDKR